MTVYTAHEPQGSGARGGTASDRIVFVRDGFSWPALLFAPIWLIWHRMWLVLLGYVLLAALIGYLPAFLGADRDWLDVAMLAFGFLFALEANALRRWSLERQGYREVGVVAGHDREECERKFFSAWLEAPPPQPARPAPLRPSAGFTPPQQQPPEVIGSFPQPGGR